jgi:hypothetical protein
LSSVTELEARNAGDRKQLIQAIFHYLGQSSIEANLIQEPVFDSLGVSIMEPAIQLKDQRIDSIRLIRAGRSGCGEAGEVLRFQYKIKLKEELPAEFITGIRARTKTIKAGKVLGLFGGKTVGVEWIGRELADVLNQDKEVSEVLLRCAQIWGEMELDIDATALSGIDIAGPWFVNPETIISLYTPGRSYEEQNCVFGYKTMDRIAKLIQDKVLAIEPEKLRRINVTH